jgi:hypothetical protein
MGKQKSFSERAMEEIEGQQCIKAVCEVNYDGDEPIIKSREVNVVTPRAKELLTEVSMSVNGKEWSEPVTMEKFKEASEKVIQLKLPNNHYEAFLEISDFMKFETVKELLQGASFCDILGGFEGEIRKEEYKEDKDNNSVNITTRRWGNEERFMECVFHNDYVRSKKQKGLI